MPITLSDFITFPFRGGRGIRGDQVQPGATASRAQPTADSDLDNWLFYLETAPLALVKKLTTMAVPVTASASQLGFGVADDANQLFIFKAGATYGVATGKAISAASSSSPVEIGAIDIYRSPKGAGVAAADSGTVQVEAWIVQDLAAFESAAGSISHIDDLRKKAAAAAEAAAQAHEGLDAIVTETDHAGWANAAVDSDGFNSAGYGIALITDISPSGLAALRAAQYKARNLITATARVDGYYVLRIPRGVDPASVRFQEWTPDGNNLVDTEPDELSHWGSPLASDDHYSWYVNRLRTNDNPDRESLANASTLLVVQRSNRPPTFALKDKIVTNDSLATEVSQRISAAAEAAVHTQQELETLGVLTTYGNWATAEADDLGFNFLGYGVYMATAAELANTDQARANLRDKLFKVSQELGANRQATAVIRIPRGTDPLGIRLRVADSDDDALAGYTPDYGDDPTTTGWKLVTSDGGYDFYAAITLSTDAYLVHVDSEQQAYTLQLAAKSYALAPPRVESIPFANLAEADTTVELAPSAAAATVETKGRGGAIFSGVTSGTADFTLAAGTYLCFFEADMDGAGDNALFHPIIRRASDNAVLARLGEATTDSHDVLDVSLAGLLVLGAAAQVHVLMRRLDRGSVENARLRLMRM